MIMSSLKGETLLIFWGILLNLRSDINGSNTTECGDVRGQVNPSVASVQCNHHLNHTV